MVVCAHPAGTHSSLALPTDAVFCVFENDAALCKKIANLISAAEVAPVPGFLPLVNQRLNFFVENLVTAFTENVEHVVKASNCVKYFPLIVRPQCAFRQSGVHFSRQIVN